MKYIIILSLILLQFLSYSQGIDMTAEYVKNITKLKGEPKTQAIIDLGKLSDPRAIIQISAYAKDPTDSSTRVAAVTATQWIRSYNSYSVALDALNDPTDDVKLAAIQSLNVITNELHGWIYPGNEATELIIKLYNESKDNNIKIAALTFLISKNNKQVGPILSLALDNPNPEIRLAAISFPYLQANPEKMNNLVKDKSNDVKSLLATFAGNIKSPQGFNILKELIKDKSPQVKSAVLQAIANYSSNEAKAIVISMLKDDDVILSSQAILSSAEMGCADYLKLQERFYTEKKVPVKMAIINAMRQATPEVAIGFIFKILNTVKTDFPDNYTSVIQISTEIISNNIKNITPDLTNLVKAKEAELRVAAAIILGQIQNSDSSKLLKILSEDEEISVRIYTIKSLAKINSPESTTLLFSLLKDRVPAVKKAVIRGLVQCKYKEANDKLVKLITDDNTSVAIEAVAALGAINADSNTITGNLLSNYKNAPMPVQTAIIYALGNTGDKRISAYLHEFIKDAPREMIIAVILASGKIHDTWVISKIAEIMNGSYQFDIDIKKASAEALSNFDGDEPLPLLNYFVYNSIPIVRNAAIWSLSKKDNNNAKSILANIIFNTKADYADRAAAIAALNAVKDDKAIKICKDILNLEINPQVKLSALTSLVNNQEPSIDIINDWLAKTTNPELVSILNNLKLKAK